MNRDRWSLALGFDGGLCRCDKRFMRRRLHHSWGHGRRHGLGFDRCSRHPIPFRRIFGGFEPALQFPIEGGFLLGVLTPHAVVEVSGSGRCEQQQPKQHIFAGGATPQHDGQGRRRSRVHGSKCIQRGSFRTDRKITGRYLRSERPSDAAGHGILCGLRRGMSRAGVSDAIWALQR